MSSFLSVLGQLVAQEITWLLQAARNFLVALAWGLIPGLVFWVGLVLVVRIWYKVRDCSGWLRRVARAFVVTAALVAVWFEWNLIAAAMLLAGFPSPLLLAFALMLSSVYCWVLIVLASRGNWSDALIDWALGGK